MRLRTSCAEGDMMISAAIGTPVDDPTRRSYGPIASYQRGGYSNPIQRGTGSAPVCIGQTEQRGRSLRSG